MLQFQFEQFVFIPSCCEVKTSGQLIPLDAKTCELLQYFCQNANRVLSRDELLQHVWQNTIVSDNTISKAIATLRKLLTDDAKNPRVIATVPKKGYRFLPQVIESSAEGVNSINLFPDQIKGQTFSNKTKLNKPLAVLFVVLLALLIIVFSPITQNHSSDIKTLTRMAGDKQDLVSSANGERLFFLNVSGKNKELWLHDIQSEKSQRILQKETNIKHLVGLNENTLVALITEKTHQRFVKAKVDNNELSVYRKSQTNLDGWIIRDSIYEPNNDSVYFLARRQNSAKNHLLALGFDDTGAKVIESNELDGLSLRQIDISPDFSKLLLLAVGADDKSTAFSFELESGDIKQLREFDGLIRNVIWHQNGEGLYYNDIPPAQRVLMIRDQNSRKQVITSSSEYLCCELARGTDSNNVIYRTNTRNYEVGFVRGEGFNVDNSTVYDMQPELLNKADGLLWVSKRSGKSQVVMQKAKQQVVELTQFSDYKVIKNIDISPDDRSLLVSESNKVHLYKLGEQQADSITTLELQERVLRAEWLDDETFALVKRINDQTVIEMFNIKGEHLGALDFRWHGLYVDNSNSELLYLLNNDFELFTVTKKNLLGDAPLQPHYLQKIKNSRLRDVKFDKQFLYQVDSAKNLLQVTDLKTNNELQQASIPINRSYGFDIKNGRMVVSQLKYSSSDLHMTRY